MQINFLLPPIFQYKLIWANIQCDTSVQMSFQVLGNVNASWGVDVFKVRELVSEERALTCVTYRIFQVSFENVPKPEKKTL